LHGITTGVWVLVGGMGVTVTEAVLVAVNVGVVGEFVVVVVGEGGAGVVAATSVLGVSVVPVLLIIGILQAREIATKNTRMNITGDLFCIFSSPI
jgi:hypothetical protein